MECYRDRCDNPARDRSSYCSTECRDRDLGPVNLDPDAQPGDGESTDQQGNIRPVPPGVENTPEEVER